MPPLPSYPAFLSAEGPSLPPNRPFAANSQSWVHNRALSGPRIAPAALLFATLVPRGLPAGAGPLRTVVRAIGSLGESAVALLAQDDKAPRTRLRDPVSAAQASPGAPQPPLPTCHLSSDLKLGSSAASRSAPAPPHLGLPGPRAGTLVPQLGASKKGPESPSPARDSAKHLGPTSVRGTSR